VNRGDQTQVANPDANGAESLWDVKGTATFLNASESAVRKWANLGDLPHVRIGTLLRFEPDEVRAWVARQRGVSA
jgi:excisionase family DNA binding protein